jgi:RNA polymerase sigma factor (sigma-70 family)
MKTILAIDAAFQSSRDQTVSLTFGKEKKRLLSFIRQRIPLRHEAEDILQDVFEQFIRHFSPAQPIEQVTTWLFRVARNRIIDRYRKKKTDSVEDHPVHTDQYEEEGRSLTVADLLFDPYDNPEDSLLREAVWEELALALQALPAEQRDVFVWHELEGESFREIAARTNQPLNTLLSRKRYAVLYLRERLQNLYNDLLNH